MDDDLIMTFLEESTENLQTIEEGLLELEKEPANRELINVVFRAMHTLKGGAGLVGLTGVTEVAHHLESVLEKIRQSGEGLSEEIFNLLLDGTDIIKQMLENKDFTGESLQEKIEDLLQGLELVEEAGAADAIVKQEKKVLENNYYKVVLKFLPEIFETGTDPLMLLLEVEENANILENYMNTTALPDIYSLDPYQIYVFWTMFIESPRPKEEIDNIFIFVKDENDISVEDITDERDIWFNPEKLTGELLVERGLVSPEDIQDVIGKQKRTGELLIEEGKISGGQMEKVIRTQQSFREQEQVDTIRVDTHKLENILNYIAELLISQSRVKALVTQVTAADKSVDVEIHNAFQEVDKIIRRLQEEVMNASMIPIGGTFVRFQRMVRDLAREKGKKVDLIITGKETELDKKVIEQIADPLKHLIRNSVDHGLETPEERTAQGKAQEGTIQLNAFHQEGSIFIEIVDDGRGINEEAIMAKAVEKGLVDPNQELTSSEIQRLLFMPGFSTAKEVTDISGRGVGLDVVVTNIKNLRGGVELSSEKGKGTKFTIKLPLTLAIIDGMMIRVGEERFIIPLTAINEFIKARPGDIRQAEGKGLILHLRKEYIPYTGLFKLLNLEADHTSPTEGILVIMKDGRKKMALLVDDIIGQEQVVIKSMKENMEQVDGIAGATIMGDGKVAIILDVSTLFRLARQKEKVLH